jgi:predicted oxidoreductase (fatty acid repression mutant protein)
MIPSGYANSQFVGGVALYLLGVIPFGAIAIAGLGSALQHPLSAMGTSPAPMPALPSSWTIDSQGRPQLMP